MNFAKNEGLITGEFIIEQVKAELDEEYRNDDVTVIVQAYSNYQEQGYALFITAKDMTENLKVAFAQARGSDSIVVYHGKSHEFDSSGNIPNGDVYDNVLFFDYDDLHKTAKYIADWIIDYVKLGRV